MGLTYFPQGIASFGVVPGLPFITGTWFFVDPTSGLSTNDGLSRETPFASVVTAYNACTDGAGDGICVMSRGSTSAATTSYLSAAIGWTKSGITVVGIAAATRFSSRARIANASSALNLANLINLSGSNNAFYNTSLYNGGTTGAGGLLISGSRNYFENVHLVGGNGMTTPTVNDYDLKFNNATENTFVNCSIGTDTFDKSDIAGAELIISGDSSTGGCSRNRFINCEFLSKRSAGTTAGIIKITSADALTRTHIFDNCVFHMYRDGGVTSEATVVIGSVPDNGFIIFKDCVRHGFTDWGAVAATGRIYSASKANAEASGITLAANPS